jgi:hypothetical protein
MNGLNPMQHNFTYKQFPCEKKTDTFTVYGGSTIREQTQERKTKPKEHEFKPPFPVANIKVRFMKSFNKLPVALLFLLVIEFFSCRVGISQTQDVARILDAIAPVNATLTGYKITAVETNVIFLPNLAAMSVLQSDATNKLSKESLKFLRELASKKNKTETNTSSSVYQFDSKNILIFSQDYNGQSNLVLESKVLVTDGEVQSFYYPRNTPNADKVDSRWAEIRKRFTNSLVGMPIFLSKTTLREFIVNSGTCSYNTGDSSAGKACFIFTLPFAPGPFPSGSMIEGYKLFVQRDTLNPVEFNCYLSDGTLLSRTVLEFDQPGQAPYVCRKAYSQDFRDGKLYKQSTWTVKSVEEDPEGIHQDPDVFIPQLTRVCDTRFEKQLSYFKGARLPNSAEINLMLTSPHGVPAYEAKTIVRETASARVSKRNNTARIILLSVFLFPLIGVILVVLKKRSS